MKKRTNLIIDAGYITANENEYYVDFYNPSDGSISYFCNALHAVCYNPETEETLPECGDALDFFHSLYRKDAFQAFMRANSSLEYSNLDDEFEDVGFFGDAIVEQNQEHRLMAIAFAAAVSETEK